MSENINLLQDGIAIIGISCKFPGAKNKDEYWNNIVNQKECIKTFSDEELSEQEHNWESLKNNPNFVKARGYLDDIDKWDAGFFNMTPKDAMVMDPQQRLWLQNTWHAFEDAGYNPYNYNGSIGVYAGSFLNTYLLNNVLRNPETYELYIRGRTPEIFQSYINSDPMFLATRTAYFYNLKGPAINVQTACSTSLVAISQACTSLLGYESDMCVAGGVTVIVPQQMGYIYQEGAIGSPDGHCRPFDIDSKGTVFGNGVGTVILKRLKDAIEDNDKIYSVIRGWAVNNDGNQKVGFTAPGIEGQYSAINMAQSFADIKADEISYIEAHGTATPLGDPIEVAALSKAFRNTTDKKQFCGLGSVKSNIGHLDAAAGVAGLIKIALSAYYKEIPATLHFKEPNPRIDFKNSPFYVVDKNLKWTENKPLIMGVSSFGVGGTNAHVILSDFKTVRKTIKTSKPGLFLLSAKSEKSLKQMQSNLCDFLSNDKVHSKEDITYTLQKRRMHMPVRSFAVSNDKQNIKESSFNSNKYDSNLNELAFVFPGQGAQLPLMGEHLYKTEPFFKSILDECFSIYREISGNDLKDILFSKNTDYSEKLLAQTYITQPALFSIEYALAKLYIHYGLSPNYMVGHSIGEFTAAAISGVFDLKSAISVVCRRGKLMQSMPTGNMASVFASSEILNDFADNQFEIAAINSQEICTISFKHENNDRVIAMLKEKELNYIPLKTSHAFHSKAFDPILDDFCNYVESFDLKEPQIPFISCLTGQIITNHQATSGRYWSNQLRNAVLFSNSIEHIGEYGNIVFLEVGPNTHLSGLIRQNKIIEDKSLILTSLGKPSDEDEQIKFYKSIGDLWMRGIDANFDLLYGNQQPNLASLPLYAFEENRYWIDYTPSPTLPYINNNSAYINDIPPKELIKNSNTDSIDEFKQIWLDVFGLKEINETDDFFELGGQSLLALQVISRIKDKLQITISLKDFLDNPTIEKLKKFIGEKPEIKSNDKTTQPIEHITNLSRLPLTNTQKRLWLIDKINGAIPSYNIPFTFDLKGSLNFDFFQKTIEILFERHHIVHASFKEENNEPYYQIHDDRKVVIKKYDISGLKNTDKEEELNKIIGENSRKTFDLNKGKLFRLCLIKYNLDEYYFHSTIHHIVFDGLSWGVFVRDFNTIYESISNIKEIALPSIKFHQYDYANWINNNNNNINLTSSETFWKENLKGINEYTNFPYDRPRSENQTGYGKNLHIVLSPDLSKKISDFSKSQNVTTFYTMLSAFSLLIRKYSGENDFCIGSPVSNRPHDFLENIFGMFVNTIPLRFKHDDITNFKDLVEYTKRISLDAISHQDLPFDKIVEIVNPERSLLYNPIFQIAFAWQNALSKPIQTSSLSGKRVSIKHGVAPFDLTFYMWEVDGIIEGDIEYNIDILDDESIVHIKNNFEKIISEVIDKPETSINDLSYISDYTKNTLSKYNSTSSTIPGKLLHELIEETASKYPNKVAVISGSTNLTYKSLNQSANKLANYLIKQDIKGQTIGVSLERSEQMLIAILAVLKAGACYLPLDPNFPSDRLDYILNDSNTKLLISTKNVSLKYKNTKVKIICINKIGLQLKLKSSQNPKIKLDKESLAYMIYTSGSTGNPKGVKVPHRSVVNLINSTQKIPGISSEDRFLAVTTLSFDISILEMFLPTSVGATVVIANNSDIKNGLALIKLIDQHDITILQSTPTTYNILLLNNWKGKADLTAICGGEPIPNKLIKSLLPKIKKLWNGYGPTETTVYSSFHEITDPNELVVVGTPVDNTKINILDKNNKLLPIGVYGEVAIGGHGVTHGYHNKNKLTSEKFINDENNHLIYKTGDWGRIRYDKTLELSGRIDNQIKIRGYRIEPGEIESTINRVEGVEEVVVKVHTFSELDNRLIAFVRKNKAINITPDFIRNSIISMLPSYMLPSAYIIINEFPKTPNGKIDKNKLIYNIEESSNKLNNQKIIFTETEQSVFKIWQDILKTSDFKENDNFFDIGGNSLLALSIIENIKMKFDIDFSLTQFFNNPTVMSTSDYIERFTHLKSNMETNTQKPEASIISGEI